MGPGWTSRACYFHSPDLGVCSHTEKGKFVNLMLHVTINTKSTKTQNCGRVPDCGYHCHR